MVTHRDREEQMMVNQRYTEQFIERQGRASKCGEGNP